MSDDEDDFGFYINADTVMPSGKRLGDCTMEEVTMTAMALLRWVHITINNYPDWSEEQRQEMSERLIDDFVEQVRALADPGEEEPIQ